MFRRIANPAKPTRPSRPRCRQRMPVTLASLTIVLALGVAQPSPAAAQDDPPSGAAASTGPVNSANARFLVDAYETLLGRSADTGGLDFHLARLAAGGAPAREAVARTMLFSVEGATREVDRAYGDLLGRAAEPAGRDHWTDHLRGHGVVDLRVLILSSDEYRNRAGGTDAAWIGALYDDLLGRTPDQPGLDHWLGLAGAGVARPLIVAGIHQSDEALGRRAAVHYQDTLHRQPDANERAGAAAIIRRLGERGLRARLMASSEAYEPFLQAALS